MRPIRVSTLEGSSLAHKYLAKVELNGSGEHSSLIQYGNNNKSKKFYITCPRLERLAWNTLTYFIIE